MHFEFKMAALLLKRTISVYGAVIIYDRVGAEVKIFQSQFFMNPTFGIEEKIYPTQ